MGGEPGKVAKSAPPDLGPPIVPDRKPLPAPGSPVGGNALAALGPPLAPAIAPTVQLDPDRPWLYTVSGPWTTASVEAALYGADLSSFESVEKVLDLATYEFHTARRLYPDLLQEPYRSQFHTAMARLLDRDVTRLENRLLEGVPHEAAASFGTDDRDTVALYLRFWAGVKDVRVAGAQQSYFDAFLGRLRDETWYTDYLLWSSKSHPFIDLVYSVGDPIEVHKIIGPNSERFGYYRPASVTVSEGKASASAASAPLDKDYVKRASDIVMDRLAGMTSKRESHEIVELLTSLPGDVQVLILQHFMARYGSNETELGIFSRSGEPTETHMLFWLFEDLTGDDREKLAESFKRTGIMKPEAIDQLVAGRSWAGRNLPYTTHLGAKATEFWAKKYNEGHTAAIVPGLFAALWTPETAGKTIMTLAGARVFPALGEASPVLGKVLLVGGTGLGAFEGTIAAQQAITGKNVWTGEQLAFEDRLGSILLAVSSALMLGAGFMGALQMRPNTSLGKLGQPAPPRLDARLINADPQTGEFTLLLRDSVSGEIVSIQGNAHAGHATVTNMTTGKVIGYVRPGLGFGPPAPGGVLPAPAATPSVVVEAVPIEEPVTTESLAKQEGVGSKPAIGAPELQPALPAGSPRLALPTPEQVPVEPAQALTPDNVDQVIAGLQARRSVTPDEIARIRAAANTKGEKWNLPDALRGEVSHILGGENLPRTFEVIDRVGPVDANGVASEVTSIKSHQPYSEGMRKPGGFLDTLKAEINDLAGFRGGRSGAVRVRVGPQTQRVLEVEVPPDTLTPETPGRPQGDAALRAQFRAEAAEAARYAASKGITLRFKAAIK